MLSLRKAILGGTVFGFGLGICVLPVEAVQETTESHEEGAVAYLAQEVPAWPRETGCFSCHNNGDAARALFRARQLGYTVAADSIADTTEWLLAPAGWETGRSSPVFSSKQLARVQFAAALTEAFLSGVVDDRTPLIQAAELLAGDQEDDGSWRVEGDSNMLASPATYGRVLATYMSRRTLETADAEQFSGRITRADQWLVNTTLGPIMDAAALVLALLDRPDPSARGHAEEAAGWILDGQSSDGGWGPYPHTPSEPFDTALALLGLVAFEESSPSERVEEAIAKGRAFLVRVQLSEGGWIETTRPSGNQSYAEHISTTGWATLALLATRPERER